MINIKENENLNTLNHSCAHLLAQSIKKLYPNALFWVGPVIEEGFYYDVDLQGKVITDADLEVITKEMKKNVKSDKLIKRIELTKDEALKMFKDDCYKLDLINKFDANEVITAYQQGEFVDLCRGPHVKSTKLLKYFRLLKVSGAYYKGDAKNKMLQRIYGICFSNEDDLNNHLELLEEAKKRDHRKIGKDLELFMFSEYGPGFPFWLPKGMILRKILEDFWYEEHTKEGYDFIQTPTLLNRDLWELSGHWNNYKDNMYTSKIDDKDFAIKPMNCPGGILVYKNSLHSYRELPLRIGELGLVHRHEASGALSGLFRVRNFTQDDAHIFMRDDQIEKEIIRLIKFIDRLYSVFNLTYDIELSTRPEEKYIGDIKTWDKAEQALQSACLKAGRKCRVNPGDGAFYGPKLDFHVKDAIGRVWQCGTIQLDMNLPKRFDLSYISESGSKERPIMVHRVIYGSIERFIGILIEHYAGAFPTWLAPVIVNIIPVNNEHHLEYANKLQQELLKIGVRVKLDNKDEKLSYRMRESQIKKIPYTFIIGDKEIKDNLISYRKYGETETKSVLKSVFFDIIKEEINSKK
ncbi:MAG: threonine--tRNA ligase [Bacilli bacterium]